MKVLLVWEEIPETTKFYVLDVAGEDLENLRSAHGKFINSDMDDDLAEWISKFLEDKEPQDHTTPFKFAGGEVILSGFMM